MKKRLAIIGFILSIIGLFLILAGASNMNVTFAMIMLISGNLFFIASIILGVIILFKKKEGKGFAITGVIISSLIILFEIYMFFARPLNFKN